MDANLIIQLISGAVGGNVAGAVLKGKSLGTLGNSLAGILGGGVGGQILAALLGAQSGGTDLQGIVSSVAAGGVGGALVLVVVSLLKGLLAKKS